MIYCINYFFINQHKHMTMHTKCKQTQFTEIQNIGYILWIPLMFMDYFVFSEQ